MDQNSEVSLGRQKEDLGWGVEHMLASHEGSKKFSFLWGKRKFKKKDKEPSSSWIRSILEDFLMKEREFL